MGSSTSTVRNSGRRSDDSSLSGISGACDANSSNKSSSGGAGGAGVAIDDGNLVIPELVAAWSSPLRVLRYEVLRDGRPVGKGATSTVLQVRDVETGAMYAMKAVVKAKAVVQTSKLEAQYRGRGVMHELDVLRRVGRHPNITRCVAFIDDPKKQKVYLLFDFEPGGLLCKTEGSREVFDESRVRSAARDVVAALSHVHARGVVYRDLKAENCLLGADGRVVLCDFGLAYVCPSVNGTQDDTLTASVGTRMYQAPESLDGKPYSGKLADVWSLGVLLYRLACGSPPFRGKRLADVEAAVRDAEVELPETLSAELRKLISGCLERDASARFTLAQVQSSEWIASGRVADEDK